MRKGFGTTSLIVIIAAIAILAYFGYLIAAARFPTSIEVTDRFDTSSPGTVTTSSIIGEISQYQFLSLVPQDRNLTDIHPSSSEVFTYEGVIISLPWNGEPSIKSRIGVGTQIKFPDGNFVMLANPYPFATIRQEFLSSEVAANQEKLSQLGPSLQSNEAFFNAVLNADLNWLTSATSSPEQAFLGTTLLPIKLSFFFESSTQAIYCFSTSRFRVFEFTDLPVKKQSYLFLFDDRDAGRLITTSGDQDEIDFIVSSLRET